MASKVSQPIYTVPSAGKLKMPLFGNLIHQCLFAIIGLELTMRIVGFLKRCVMNVELN